VKLKLLVTVLPASSVTANWVNSVFIKFDAAESTGDNPVIKLPVEASVKLLEL